MAFYVYIIQSELDGTFYKGSSQNPLTRLERHNLGHTTSTKFKRPWKLVYVEVLPSKTDMLIREKKLKRGNKLAGDNTGRNKEKIKLNIYMQLINTIYPKMKSILIKNFRAGSPQTIAVTLNLPTFFVSNIV